MRLEATLETNPAACPLIIAAVDDTAKNLNDGNMLGSEIVFLDIRESHGSLDIFLLYIIYY